MKTKAIEYSYPTSPNAIREGFPNGCYHLTIFDGAKFPERSHFRETREEVEAIAETVNLPWYQLPCVK